MRKHRSYAERMYTKIAILVGDPDQPTRMMVDGVPCGAWNATRVPGSARWRVSHQSGYAIGEFFDEVSEALAVRVAKKLSADHPMIHVRWPAPGPTREDGYIVQAIVAEELSK